MSFARRDIGRLIAMERGIIPEDSVAATINGPAIDRFSGGGTSAVLHAACGAATGSPSTQTVDAKIQDSADGSTGWADLSPAIATTQLTADDTESESANVNLINHKRHIRVVVTVGFSGGSTPTIPVSATLCLGGRD